MFRHPGERRTHHSRCSWSSVGINPIYGVESWRNLARSIDMLSDDRTITYLAHEARGDDEAMDDFQAFSADFLSCERIAHQPDKRLSLFKIRRRTTETAA
jgi:hypothetical protein